MTPLLDRLTTEGVIGRSSNVEKPVASGRPRPVPADQWPHWWASSDAEVPLVYFDAGRPVKLLVEEPGTELAVSLWDGCDAAVSSS